MTDQPAFDPDRMEHTDPALYAFWHDEQVRFADLDLLGHANNNAFGVYLESGRVAFMRSNGVTDNENHRGIVLARITIDYKAELAYLDRLRVGVRVLRLGTSSITLGAAIFRGETCAATSWGVAVLIDTRLRRPTPLDAALRERLARHLR